tara:strand:- start:746 stop:2017 length:1272 start_codon:yes stop_codon:yes gene_type:complete
LKINIIDKLISSENLFKSKYIELMKYELLCNLYHNGEQFSNPIVVKNKPQNFTLDNAYYLIIKIFNLKRNSNNSSKILSSANTTWNNEIQKLGYNTVRPPWSLSNDLKIETDYEIFLLYRKIKHCFKYKSFNFLVTDQFISLLHKFYIKYSKFCVNQNYSGLVLLEYNSFFSKIALLIFKELSKPTFFLHHGGIPTMYEKKIQDRCDYFIMWGKKQVEAYVSMGYNKKKFFVSGHPSYSSFPKKLKFDLDNILVINKSLMGAHPMEKPHQEDKGNAIMYLNILQNVLKKVGVKNVTLKVHPSENINWYYNYIDNSFFKKPNSVDINHCLRSSTLVIGPASTVIIDTIFSGLNYVVFEPNYNNKTILGWDINPPIDGKDSRIPVAFNENELFDILTKKIKIDVDVLEEFVQQPLDISFFKEIIK